jgi:hypothetical protein
MTPPAPNLRQIKKAEGDMPVCPRLFVVIGCLVPYLHPSPGRRLKVKAVPKIKGEGGKGTSQHDGQYCPKVIAAVKTIFIMWCFVVDKAGRDGVPA